MFITLLLIATIALAIILIQRNEEVYQHQTVLLDTIYRKAKQDIESGKEYEWRYKALDAVTYSEMVWKFWKPLDSFHEDKSFLK